MLNLSEIDKKRIYLIPRKVTIETSLRVFQYKILNNFLYLNNGLYKFGFADSPPCSLYAKQSETINHRLLLYKHSEAMEIIVALASSLSSATHTDSRSSHNWKIGRRAEQ